MQSFFKLSILFLVLSKKLNVTFNMYDPLPLSIFLFNFV